MFTETIDTILSKPSFTVDDIVMLLESKDEGRELLFQRSAEVKERYIGNKVWPRGLIEFSNICGKNCLYCGIRRGNKNTSRYSLSDEAILRVVSQALENGYSSIALQSGEIESDSNTLRIEKLLTEIKKLSGGRIGITLSVGEQEYSVYKRWYDAGAHRYLLRVEASDNSLYEKIHPTDSRHSQTRRIECLKSLKSIGYQTGTGVMIGLPFQTSENLAHDLLFMQNQDIDMCGMGPYIEHPDTPLMAHSGELMPLKERLDLSLKMIAILRIMMKDINIVASTALQAIDPLARERAVAIGANIIMPNITPDLYKSSYKLYKNKPGTNDNPTEGVDIKSYGGKFGEADIVLNEWGDSKHYKNRVVGSTTSH